MTNLLTGTHHEMHELKNRCDDLEREYLLIKKRLNMMDEAIRALNVKTVPLTMIGSQPLDKTFHPGGMFNPDSAIKTTVGDSTEDHF